MYHLSQSFPINQSKTNFNNSIARIEAKISSSVVLNGGHGYCMLVAVASAFVMAYGGFNVGGARKKYNVNPRAVYEKYLKEYMRLIEDQQQEIK